MGVPQEQRWQRLWKKREVHLCNWGGGSKSRSPTSQVLGTNQKLHGRPLLLRLLRRQRPPPPKSSTTLSLPLHLHHPSDGLYIYLAGFQERNRGKGGQLPSSLQGVFSANFPVFASKDTRFSQLSERHKESGEQSIYPVAKIGLNMQDWGAATEPAMESTPSQPQHFGHSIEPQHKTNQEETVSKARRGDILRTK